ncbi:MAG: hypothetical protein D6820_06315, partial [Lentisphaerae bacterium]
MAGYAYSRFLHPVILILFAVTVLSRFRGMAQTDESNAKKSDILLIECQNIINHDFVREKIQALEVAKKEASKIRFIVLELNSSEGDIEAVRRLAEKLFELKRPIYVYVHSTAIGPAAILTFIGRKLFFAPDARVGAITTGSFSAKSSKETPQKNDLLIRTRIDSTSALVRGYAQRFGYRSDVAEAMVDPEARFKWKSRSVDKGQLLVLTANECVELQDDQKPLHGHRIVHSRNELIQILTRSKTPPSPVTLEKFLKTHQSEQFKLTAKRVTKTKVNGSKLLILNLDTEFDKPLLYYFRRGFSIAQQDRDVAAVIVRMDTPGGYVKIMKEIIGLVMNCRVPVILFVEQHAYSAGAISSFAFKEIYMKEG